MRKKLGRQLPAPSEIFLMIMIQVDDNYQDNDYQEAQEITANVV